MPRRLMGAREIAVRLKVSRQRVQQLVKEPGFPAAYDELAMGKVWRRRDVERWIASHRPTDAWQAPSLGKTGSAMASYDVNPAAVDHARKLIDARQYVLDSDWGDAQPRAADENEYLEKHGFADYGRWFLGLTEGAGEETKARYAFVYGDFRRIHRTGLIACVYRAAEWRHKDVERAAYDLLQRLDDKAA